TKGPICPVQKLSGESDNENHKYTDEHSTPAKIPACNLQVGRLRQLRRFNPEGQPKAEQLICIQDGNSVDNTQANPQKPGKPMTFVGQFRPHGQIQNCGEGGFHLFSGVVSAEDNLCFYIVKRSVFVVKKPTILLQFLHTAPEQPAVLPPYLHAGKRVRQIPTLGSSLRIFFYRVWPVGEIPILKGNGFVLSHGKTGSLSLNSPGIYGSALCLMGYQNGIPIGITHPGQG